MAADQAGEGGRGALCVTGDRDVEVVRGEAEESIAQRAAGQEEISATLDPADTSQTGRGEKPARGLRAGHPSPVQSGSSTKNRLPLPAWLSAQTLPPMARTSLLTMARPRPEPLERPLP